MSKFFVIMLTVCCITLMSFRLTNGDQPTTNTGDTQIHWLTFDEAVKKNQEAPKKVIVDLYTGWCTWCTKMDKATFQHPAIAKYINDNFYAVKLDAEMRNTIHFKNNDYVYRAGEGKEGVNEIAVFLTRGKLNYPSVVFLDESMGNPQPIAGFQSPIRMDKLLKYFGENHYRRVDWGLFNQVYKSPLEATFKTNN